MGNNTVFELQGCQRKERPSPGDQMKPTVFIIDDEASIRTSISRLLVSLGFRTEVFASAEEFLKWGRYEGIGCIVLDVRMPGLSGMDLQDELNKADYSMPIIFITGHGDVPMSVQAMKKGAVDFLPKPFDEDQLLDAVRSAIEKDRRAKAERAEVRDVQGRVEQLTPREYEIFCCVITGMRNKDIACRLGMAVATVKNHKGKVFRKLESDSLPELMHMGKKAGIAPAN